MASHSLVSPGGTLKPIMEWSCHDVQVGLIFFVFVTVLIMLLGIFIYLFGVPKPSLEWSYHDVQV